MRKVKLFAVAAIFGVLGFAPSTSSAMTCHDSIDEVCAVAAKVICGVVNKGRPCLM